MKRENDKYHLMKVFHEVAIKGSFTKAAQSLAMTTSSVSKAVNQLEQSLQTKLLFRTTRSQSLTDSGRLYVSTAKQMLAQLRELEERLHTQRDEPSGLLRITMPTALGQFFIAPKIHEFMQSYPKIGIDMELNEGLVDITKQGFDLAIRSVDVPANSRLYSFSLGHHRQKLVASPVYIAKYGLPQKPQDLLQRPLLAYQGPQITSSWSFECAGQQQSLQPEAIYNSNNYYALLMAAKNGIGVANLYQYMVDDDIKAGNLVHILPQWQQQPRARFALFQQRRDASPKLDVFLRFVAQLFD